MNLHVQKKALEEFLNEKNQAGLLKEMRTRDASDMAQDLVDQHITVGCLENRYALVTEIRGALSRIADGSYGSCLGCEKKIADKRLLAVPWAKFCTRCQEAIENQLIPCA
ncbi:MAG: TraR/DksA family transcriptional regulator [Patescibacteria group bacterium]|nr:TraR/DksA family transcriptional regulator [Patescibacteria group bacterium]